MGKNFILLPYLKLKRHGRGGGYLNSAFGEMKEHFRKWFVTSYIGSVVIKKIEREGVEVGRKEKMQSQSGPIRAV